MPPTQQPPPQKHKNQTLGFLGICCSGVCAIILFYLNVMMVALGVSNTGLCKDKNPLIPKYMIGKPKTSEIFFSVRSGNEKCNKIQASIAFDLLCCST